MKSTETQKVFVTRDRLILLLIDRLIVRPDVRTMHTDVLDGLQIRFHLLREEKVGNMRVSRRGERNAGGSVKISCIGNPSFDRADQLTSLQFW